MTGREPKEQTEQIKQKNQTEQIAETGYQTAQMKQTNGIEQNAAAAYAANTADNENGELAHTAALEDVPGLIRYVKSPRYRNALSLPPDVTETYTLLAQGEYNRNYVWTHPVSGKKLLLRINFGSQMHLADQIGYEYHALSLLEQSGRTPHAYYVDGSRAELSEGVMVMEFLPGHALLYETELLRAAAILADIHSMRVPAKHGLIAPKAPLRAILEECEAMFRIYTDAACADAGKIKKIRELLQEGWRHAENPLFSKPPYRCIVNTELNATNFLIQENAAAGDRVQDSLIDWEKPVFADPAQDLGHFLAPTTTFWKTDVILQDAEMNQFLEAYINAVSGRYDTSGLLERAAVYIPLTCLRGITWCAMAWVEYQNPEKKLTNASTRAKLDAYLSDAFLEQIQQFMKAHLS